MFETSETDNRRVLERLIAPRALEWIVLGVVTANRGSG
jgi:hypothetical protein